MKLSEMPTRKAAECLAELAEPFGVILKTPAVEEYLKKAANKEATVSMLVDAFIALLPSFLREHFDETAKILAVLTGKTPEEIGDQTLKVTIDDVKDSFDGELIGFFTK